MSWSVVVDNVKCAGCASTIKTNLVQIDGVSEVSVDIGTGQVTLECEDLLRSAVLEKLAELGYPERGAGR